MDSKVVTFVFCIVLLYGCVNLEDVNGTKADNAGDIGQETEACDCGSHGNCSLVEGLKVCHCDHGFAVLDGNCEVCNCGQPEHTCHFDRGFKDCNCAEGHYKEHGLCQALPLPRWEVLEKGAYYIIFRFFPINNASDFENADVVVSTHRNVNLEEQLIVHHYTYLTSKVEDYTIFLDGPGTYEFRFQLLTKLGNSSWTEWQQFSWRDHSNFTGAPEILRPLNNSEVDAGLITTEWRAPPDADETVTKYKVLLLKRTSDTIWSYIGPKYVDHVINQVYYNTTFDHYDPTALYKLSVTSRGLNYESNVSSPVYFTASIPPPQWEVREKGAYYIIFRFFSKSTTQDFRNPDVVETTYRDVNLDKQPIVTYYTYMITQEQDLIATLGYPGTFKFRFRLSTKLGNGSWSEWSQFSWRDHSNFTGAPEILRPLNGSEVNPGLITTEWRAPPDADVTVTNYRVLLLKLIGTDRWLHIGPKYVKHVANIRYYDTTFIDYDPSAFYRLTVDSFGSSYETNVSSPVYFKASDGNSTANNRVTAARRWVTVLVSVMGGVLGILLLSLCIYCCAKKRMQIV